MGKDVGRLLVMGLSILAVVLSGCAKRPGMTGLSAPAPTGSVTAMRQDSSAAGVTTGTRAGPLGDQSSTGAPGPGALAPGATGPESTGAAGPAMAGAGPAAPGATEGATAGTTEGATAGTTEGATADATEGSTPGQGAPSASPGTPPAGAVMRPAERPAPREFEANASLKTIHFDFDKSEIRPGDATILDTSAQWLVDNPTLLLLIQGHCDERGTNEYNLALGERRAEATRNYLVSRGVQTGRISLLSYGEERPLCTEQDENCWSQNRRAELLTKTGQ